MWIMAIWRARGIDRPTPEQLAETYEMALLVLFRLLCQGPGRAPFLVDYLVPAGDYPGLARAIESSIGSLETF
jgi:hypothetical protein